MIIYYIFLFSQLYKLYLRFPWIISLFIILLLPRVFLSLSRVLLIMYPLLFGCRLCNWLHCQQSIQVQKQLSLCSQFGFPLAASLPFFSCYLWLTIWRLLSKFWASRWIPLENAQKNGECDMQIGQKMESGWRNETLAAESAKRFAMVTRTTNEKRGKCCLNGKMMGAKFIDKIFAEEWELRLREYEEL